MPFRIIRNDITKVKADIIVNTANPMPTFGEGTDRTIYEAAGKEALLKERISIGKIDVGQVAVTSAFNLPAKYIIHTVGPVWQGGNHGEAEHLRCCYKNSLYKAVASAIYLARTGCSKEEIKLYIIDNFAYDLSRSCDEIRPYYHHVESCQQTVPEAITAFLEGLEVMDRFVSLKIKKCYENSLYRAMEL